MFAVHLSFCKPPWRSGSCGSAKRMTFRSGTKKNSNKSNFFFLFSQQQKMFSFHFSLLLSRLQREPKYLHSLASTFRVYFSFTHSSQSVFISLSLFWPKSNCLSQRRDLLFFSPRQAQAVHKFTLSFVSLFSVTHAHTFRHIFHTLLLLLHFSLTLDWRSDVWTWIEFLWFVCVCVCVLAVVNEMMNEEFFSLFFFKIWFFFSLLTFFLRSKWRLVGKKGSLWGT